MDKTLLIQHPFILKLKSAMPLYTDAILTGGAIFDVLSKRKPKDWDFTNSPSFNLFLEQNAQIVSNSSTATTYIWENEIIQVLERSNDSFTLTIEQAQYNVRISTLTIHEQSFNNKVIIPTRHMFDKANKMEIVNCLIRIKHWENKGMTIADVTYNSLLNKLSKEISNES